MTLQAVSGLQLHCSQALCLPHIICLQPASADLGVAGLAPFWYAFLAAIRMRLTQSYYGALLVPAGMPSVWMGSGEGLAGGGRAGEAPPTTGSDVSMHCSTVSAELRAQIALP